MRSGALLLVLLSAAAGLAAATERDGVFVGYKEVGVDGGDGGSLHAEGGEAADSGAATDSGAAADGDAATTTGRTVLLHTQFGPIRVKMLEQLAPHTTALVWDLAQRRGCNDCAFYRNEAQPRSGSGPPYALLQGRLPELSEVPPREGNIEVKMGHACFIPETKDFFIAYADHPEWETSHTVWGVVDEWFATDLMIAQQYKEVTHPEYGTVMRMMKVEVPVKAAVEGDTTYSGLLGPLH
ncbi:hypothetical protein ABPG75_005356 [Micractinium tetrahymenae]